MRVGERLNTAAAKLAWLTELRRFTLYAYELQQIMQVFSLIALTTINVAGYILNLSFAALAYIWLPRLALILLEVVSSKSGRRSLFKGACVIAEVFMLAALLARTSQGGAGEGAPEKGGQGEKSGAQATLAVYAFVTVGAAAAFLGVTLVYGDCGKRMLGQFSSDDDDASSSSGASSGSSEGVASSSSSSSSWSAHESMSRLQLLPVWKLTAQSTLHYRRAVLHDIGASRLQTARQLLRHLFVGAGAGATMISYCWVHTKYNGKHAARTCARAFPRQSRWLDVEKLVPGVPLQATLRRAVDAAHLVIVFMSERYWASENCRVEFSEVEDRPEKCLIFLFPGDGLDGADDADDNTWEEAAATAACRRSTSARHHHTSNPLQQRASASKGSTNATASGLLTRPLLQEQHSSLNAAAATPGPVLASGGKEGGVRSGTASSSSSAEAAVTDKIEEAAHRRAELRARVRRWRACGHFVRTLPTTPHFLLPAGTWPDSAADREAHTDAFALVVVEALVDATADPGTRFELGELLKRASPAVVEDWRATAMALTPVTAAYLHGSRSGNRGGTTTTRGVMRRNSGERGSSSFANGDGRGHDSGEHREDISDLLTRTGVTSTPAAVTPMRARTRTRPGPDDGGCDSGEYQPERYRLRVPGWRLVLAALRSPELWDGRCGIWFCDAPTMLLAAWQVGACVYYLHFCSARVNAFNADDDAARAGSCQCFTNNIFDLAFPSNSTAKGGGGDSMDVALGRKVGVLVLLGVGAGMGVCVLLLSLCIVGWLHLLYEERAQQRRLKSKLGCFVDLCSSIGTTTTSNDSSSGGSSCSNGSRRKRYSTLPPGASSLSALPLLSLADAPADAHFRSGAIGNAGFLMVVLVQLRVCERIQVRYYDQSDAAAARIASVVQPYAAAGTGAGAGAVAYKRSNYSHSYHSSQEEQREQERLLQLLPVFPPWLQAHLRALAMWGVVGRVTACCGGVFVDSRSGIEGNGGSECERGSREMPELRLVCVDGWQDSKQQGAAAKDPHPPARVTLASLVPSAATAFATVTTAVHWRMRASGSTRASASVSEPAPISITPTPAAQNVGHDEVNNTDDDDDDDFSDDSFFDARQASSGALRELTPQRSHPPDSPSRRRRQRGSTLLAWTGRPFADLAPAHKRLFQDVMLTCGRVPTAQELYTKALTAMLGCHPGALTPGDGGFDVGDPDDEL